LTVLSLRNVGGDLGRLDPLKYTITGLEKNLSRRQILHRKFNTIRHVQAVMDAQHHAAACFGDDDGSEHLKAVSEMFSKQTKQRAHLRGVLDQNLLYC